MISGRKIKREISISKQNQSKILSKSTAFLWCYFREGYFRETFWKLLEIAFMLTAVKNCFCQSKFKLHESYFRKNFRKFAEKTDFESFWKVAFVEVAPQKSYFLNFFLIICKILIKKSSKNSLLVMLFSRRLHSRKILKVSRKRLSCNEKLLSWK